MSHKEAGPVEDGHWFEEHSLFVRYLIVSHTHHRMDVLISQATGEPALPVFSTDRAARDFLRSGDLGAWWHVRESTAGELISLLMGHVAEVERIVLDPPSELTLGDESSPKLLSKKAFIGSLMKEPMLMSPR